MSKQAELLQKASQPVRAFTNANANGMIQQYMRVVEQLMREKAQTASASASGNEKRTS